MRDSKTLLAALAVVAALVVSAVPASAQMGRIGGTIKDQNGQPIKGATVTAENPAASPSSFTATTDDRGRYSIIGLKSGSWMLTAAAPGFQPSSGNVPVRTVGTPLPPVDFVLAPGAAGPAGALAGVNTKELQAELAQAEEIDRNGQQYDDGHRRVPGHARQDAGPHDAAHADWPRAAPEEGLRRRARLVPDAAGRRAHQRQVEDRGRHDPPREGRLRRGRDARCWKWPSSTSASREVFYNLGEVKFAKGETDEAVTYYQRAVDIDGNWGKPLFKMGLAKLQKADTAGAIEIMNKVIAVDPNSAEAAQAKALIEQLKKG